MHNIGDHAHDLMEHALFVVRSPKVSEEARAASSERKRQGFHVCFIDQPLLQKVAQHQSDIIAKPSQRDRS